MVDVVRRFTPKTIDGFVGNRGAHDQLREEIRNNKSVYITGIPGSGKTSAIYVIANELGYTVIETNASDERRRAELQDILRMCQLPSLTGEKLIILLDEVDGLSAWGTIGEILKLSRHPVAMTANQDKLPTNIKNRMTHIKLKRPRINQVTEHIKFVALKEGVQPDYSQVTRDVRSALITALYGSEKYDDDTIFSRVQNLFKHGAVDKLTMNDAPWLIDNASSFLSGSALCEFFRLLDIASRSNILVLENIITNEHAGGFPKVPGYFRRINAYRSKRAREKRNE